MRLLVAMLFASAAAPAVAQDHSGHTMPSAQSPVQTECEKEAARHRAMGHPVEDGACAPATQPAPGGHADGHTGRDHSQMGGMDHSTMDHSKMEGMDHSTMSHESIQLPEQTPMDHGAMGHGGMDMTPIPEGPPPASAGSGPPRAADAIWGADAMHASRNALSTENGGMNVFWFQGDRAEYRAREGGDGYLWDVQGYYGGDLDKFWFKSEGEGTFGESPESAEVQGLWSHAIGPWWDLQAGVRQDLTGPERTHAVIGVQGLAPYMFEVDAAAFLSNKGDLTASIEAELDQRITQRLILQPRAELSLSAQDVPELGVGAGLDTVELGVRLRYEIAREFAPYIGIEQEWKLGRSADYARLAGEDPSVTNYVVGIRFWF
ncbi:copper resistance protein B [Qipengyuania sp. YG27]|uniref:Copper resistance protein B n=1 Tax=Qipengyuania mesophila TaxID=2867246 RepID=A0ABS7JXJ8_9SPHN|nr:copper resistance protein B [Qipengyuania mesophila]MBX7502384.1 copper resistance protein B [Qipengyuania mesophila]